MPKSFARLSYSFSFFSLDRISFDATKLSTIQKKKSETNSPIAAERGSLRATSTRAGNQTHLDSSRGRLGTVSLPFSLSRPEACNSTSIHVVVILACDHLNAFIDSQRLTIQTTLFTKCKCNGQRTCHLKLFHRRRQQWVHSFFGRKILLYSQLKRHHNHNI